MQAGKPDQEVRFHVARFQNVRLEIGDDAPHFRDDAGVPPLALRDIDHRHAGGPGSFGQVALASAALVGRERNVNRR